jgi:hypothetical protein
MELSDSAITKIVSQITDRLGLEGLISAHRPANRDNVVVIQIRSKPLVQFEMASDADEREIRRKTEQEIIRAQSEATRIK